VIDIAGVMLRPTIEIGIHHNLAYWVGR